MKRIFSHPLAAFIAGLGLRLFFVLKFPATSADTVLYEQIATNWLKHHVYAMDVGGAITPVDLRMPGYPAFLAIIYALTGRTGADARFWVTLAQVVVDMLGCVFVVALAVFLLGMGDEHARQRPVMKASFCLAMLCPFTANYTAVPLTEPFAVALTAAGLTLLLGLFASIHELLFPVKKRPWEWPNDFRHWAAPLGFVVGIGTLFRPETPLLLLAAWIGTAFQLLPHRKSLVWLRIVVFSGLACVLPLLPWVARNAVTLHEIQLLAPKDSNLPGELVPSGFMAWEKTWLFRMRDCYLAPWKLNGEAMDVEQLPARAFDSTEEKERVAMILEAYNEELTLTKEEDAAFAQLARERTARHPLRTYVWLPLLRAVTLWFAPRIELLPVSGTVFPLGQSWEDDRVDQSATIGLFLINIFYLGIGVYGATKLWRWSTFSRGAVLLIVLFMALRTAFLTTLETPEPRYVLECFPAVIALGAVGLAGRRYEEPESEARVKG
jgi:hypothetical protein